MDLALVQEHKNELMLDVGQDNELKKGKRVFFLGTTYRTSDGIPSVRYICETGGDPWNWHDDWLD